MRFRLDGEADSRLPSFPHLRPKPVILDSVKRVEFLKLLNEGLGWTTSRLQLGIGVRDLRQTLASCVDFRHAVAQVKKVRVERLYGVLYQAAIHGDTRAAQYLLARYDRVAERRNSRPDASF
jgi:hypothetical protein